MGKKFIATALVLGTVGSLSALFYVVSARELEQISSLSQKLEYQAFCRTALDIASSKLHYQARFAADEKSKSELVRQSDQLLSEKNKMDKMIEETKKQILLITGTDERKNLLAPEERGDLRAVREAGSVSDSELLDHVNDACLNFFTK